MGVGLGSELFLVFDHEFIMGTDERPHKLRGPTKNERSDEKLGAGGMFENTPVTPNASYWR